MESNFSIKKNILFGGFSSTYTISHNSELSESDKLNFAVKCLHQLLPSEVLRNKIIKDFKGRDANNLINHSIAAKLRPTGDELFFILGSAQSQSQENDKESDSEVVEPEEFSYRIDTIFHEFLGRKHISHSCKSQSYGPLPEALLNKHLDPDPNVKVEALRVGIDFYNAHLFGFLGFAPEVTQTLLIELYQSHLTILISADRLKSKDELPLQQNNTFQILHEILKDMFNFDLNKDYRQTM